MYVSLVCVTRRGGGRAKRPRSWVLGVTPSRRETTRRDGVGDLVSVTGIARRPAALRGVEVLQESEPHPEASFPANEVDRPGELAYGLRSEVLLGSGREDVGWVDWFVASACGCRKVILRAIRQVFEPRPGSVPSTTCDPAPLAHTPRSHPTRVALRHRRCPRRRDPRPPPPDPRAATSDRPTNTHRNRPDDPCASRHNDRSITSGSHVSDCPTRHRAAMTPPTRRPALDPTARSESGAPTGRSRGQATHHSPR